MTLALRSRLKACGSVVTRVQCDTLGLLSGRVEGVQLEGRDWVSPMGLAAERLEVRTQDSWLNLSGLL